jgi:hypothetical protein
MPPASAVSSNTELAFRHVVCRIFANAEVTHEADIGGDTHCACLPLELLNQPCLAHSEI